MKWRGWQGGEGSGNGSGGEDVGGGEYGCGAEVLVVMSLVFGCQGRSW